MSRASKPLAVLRDPPPGPSQVALISITTMCNAQCRFCCVLDSLNTPELNPSDARLVESIRQARADGCTTLALTGGEPTVYPRFIELCHLGRELGYESITINTNGIKFRSRSFTERALKAGLSHIDFSIHGHTAALHDEMVGRPGAFACIERAMEHLRELAPQHGTVLGATCVVTASNARHLGEVARTLIELGFTSLRFKHCFEGAPGSNPDLVERYTELMPAVREAVRRCRQARVGIQLTHFPLCLMGDEVVWATDLTDENVLSVGTEGQVLADGRASQYRRTDGTACTRCLMSNSCARLDDRYRASFGEDELRPFAEPAALTAILSSGDAQYQMGENQRLAFDRLLARHGAPPLPSRPTTNRPTRQNRISVHLGGRCNLVCHPLCDCRASASEANSDGIPVQVHGGGGQLYLRGESALQPAFGPTLAAAQRAGWEEIWVRSNGLLFTSKSAAGALRQRGVTGVILPLFSQAPLVHDQIAGRPGVLHAALSAAKTLHDSGIRLALEVALLPRRLQNLSALIRLVHDAAPSLASLRLYIAPRPVPRALAPPRWKDLNDELPRAFQLADALGISAVIGERDGIPRCAVPISLHDRFASIELQRPAASNRALPAACDGCVLSTHCLGPAESYVAAHDEPDVRPFSSFETAHLLGATP